MASAWGTSWGSAWSSSWGSVTPAQPASSGGGGFPLWNPLLDFDREKKGDLLEAVRLIEEESGVKRERAKARKLEREIVKADSPADLRALAARITWAIDRANELRRQEDDEEMAVVLMLMH